MSNYWEHSGKYYRDVTVVIVIQLNPPREMKIGSQEIEEFEKSGIKKEVRKQFWFELLGGLKDIDGLGDSTEVILSVVVELPPCLPYACMSRAPYISLVE